MTPARATAMLAVLAVAAVPAAAQQPEPASVDRYRALIAPALEPPLPDDGSGLSFRVQEQFQPDGTRHERRGIIAGFEVAPQTTVGLGLFETLPKRVVRSDEERLDVMPKRSRKAALGLTLKF
jgi:hypothetical protein